MKEWKTSWGYWIAAFVTLIVCLIAPQHWSSLIIFLPLMWFIFVMIMILIYNKKKK